MKKYLIEKTIEHYRAIFFAGAIFLFFEILIKASDYRDILVYILISSLGFALLIAELLISRYILKKNSKEWAMPHLSTRLWREHFMNHAILPSLLYLMTAIFIWNNNIVLFDQVFVLMVSLAYLPLFVNIHATYKNELKVRRETFYIFDLVRIMIFFFGIDGILDIGLLYDLSPIFKPLLVTGLSFLLLVLMIWLSKQLSYTTYIFAFVSSILVGLVFAILAMTLTLNPLTLSLVSTIMFFMVLTYWHHKLDGTFNLNIFLEYFLFSILLVVILLGLSK